MNNKKNNKLIESTKNGLKLNDKNILYKMPKTNNVDIKDNSQELKLNFEEKVDLKKYLSEIIDATIEERIEDAIEKKVTGTVEEKVNEKFINKCIQYYVQEIHKDNYEKYKNLLIDKNFKKISNNITYIKNNNDILHQYFYIKDESDNVVKAIKNNLDNYKVHSILQQTLDNLNCSQTKLAELTGISRGTIITILKNPESISLKNAYKIAKVLNISIEELFPFIELNSD